MKQVMLKPGREKSLRRRHPWVFSGAVASAEGAPGVGETVRVVAADGRFLALGSYSPQSQIRVRILSFDLDAVIDGAFIHARVRAAAAYRARVLPPELTAYRLVHGESDGLPGVIVDRYGDVAVMQLTSAGGEFWREAIVAAIVSDGTCSCVYERSDAEVRSREGLAARSGIVHGALPATAHFIEEAGRRYRVGVSDGQKTGFYLDQRDNRARVAALARGTRVLDAFCYTGGFGVAALSGGATRVTALDSSAEALAQARENVAANGFEPEAVRWLEADAFKALRELHAAGERFDLIVLDPPKFAPSAKHVTRAARAYKDVNLWAMRLLAPGGRLLSFSCSGAVDAQLFQSIVAGAAVDAELDGRIAHTLGAGADHPVALPFPEGAYLKGLEIVRD